MGALSLTSSAVEGGVMRLRVRNGIAYAVISRKGLQVADLSRAVENMRAATGGEIYIAGYWQMVQQLEDLVWKAGKHAGLTRLASPYRLRHSYATHLLKNGADVQQIQVLMGHASLSSTQVYLGIGVSDLSRMIERSPAGASERRGSVLLGPGLRVRSAA